MLKVAKFRLPVNDLDSYICEKLTAMWYFLRDVFEGIFKVVPFFGLFFNKLLILIGFIAFFGWMWYMTKNQSVEKID